MTCLSSFLGRALPAACIALLVAACASSAPAPSSAPGSPAVSTAPTPSATAEPSAQPPSGGSAATVSLANATGNEVVIDVVAPAGLVVTAASGAPGDGASIESGRLQVTNDDAATLRFAWTGGPCDAALVLTLDPANDQAMLVQPECPGDSVAFDRILVLHLARAVDASSLEAVLQDGTDTAG